MTAATSPTAAFLAAVRKSGLIDGPRLQPYLAPPTADAAPAALAERLVGDGLLTPFQARLLLQGKPRRYLLANKYRLLDQLGAGGMGAVYLCEHVLMRRLVAVKVLPRDQLATPGVVERFHREARAVAALNHPNVVHAYDVDREGAVHFLVMEYVDGSSLQAVVDRGGPLAVARAAHCIAQAAAGLEYAHQAGWVHRDVKPGNLLLDRGGVLKILDLGLARMFRDSGDKLTQELAGASVLGTADYVAPEQAMQSHGADIRADVYSLGATFYFLLTGGPLFPDGTAPQKLLWHQLKAPVPVRTRRPEVPAELAAVVHRMLAKRPEDRYQTPAEVVAALAPWTQTPIPLPTDEEMPAHSPAVRRLLPGWADASASRVTARLATAGVAAVTPVIGQRSSGTRRAPAAPLVPAAPVPVARRRGLLVALAAVGLAGVVGAGLVLAPWEATPAATQGAAPRPAAPSPPKDDPAVAVPVIRPEEAERHVGTRCTVEMVVRRAAIGTKDTVVFLNSLENWRDPRCFTVLLTKERAEDLGQAWPEGWKGFQGKTIRVRGRITRYEETGQYQIKFKDLEHLEVVGDGG